MLDTTTKMKRYAQKELHTTSFRYYYFRSFFSFAAGLLVDYDTRTRKGGGAWYLKESPNSFQENFLKKIWLILPLDARRSYCM
jgi:hypothetical protein